MKRRFYFWVLCALLALGAGCGRKKAVPIPDRKQHPYSLIWISLDTLRADHLGLYGYDRDTSPFLDELARKGMHFPWCVAPQNSTLPSHVTMFTGHHPMVHQIMFSSTRERGVKMSDALRTITQVLQDRGFATRAFTDGGKVSAYYGFDRGFDRYDDDDVFLPDKLEEVLEYLDGLEPGRPFFCFIHTYQIHGPYAAPEPYDTLFVTEGERTEAREKMDRYDGCIRFVDDQLRGFVADLEERGLLEDTILAITGDHGEGFAEYGYDHIGHRSPSLHQNITRVPWILLHPESSIRGPFAGGLVGLIDFPNTILALLGFDESMPGGGVDLFGPRGKAPREYVSWTARSLSFYAGEYHLLTSEKIKGPKANALYRFAADPAETTPLEEPQQWASMQSRLTARLKGLNRESRLNTSKLRELGELPDRGSKLMEQLEALGYLK